MKERDYNQIDALKYLVEAGPTHTDEWAEAGMYHILSKVVLEDARRYTKQELDKFIEEASSN